MSIKKSGRTKTKIIVRLIHMLATYLLHLIFIFPVSQRNIVIIQSNIIKHIIVDAFSLVNHYVLVIACSDSDEYRPFT